MCKSASLCHKSQSWLRHLPFAAMALCLGPGCQTFILVNAYCWSFIWHANDYIFFCSIYLLFFSESFILQQNLSLIKEVTALLSQRTELRVIPGLSCALESLLRITIVNERSKIYPYDDQIKQHTQKALYYWWGPYKLKYSYTVFAPFIESDFNEKKHRVSRTKSFFSKLLKT